MTPDFVAWMREILEMIFCVQPRHPLPGKLSIARRVKGRHFAGRRVGKGAVRV